MYNTKGFTLMEIVIVLALIGILTAIVVPGLKNWQETHRVTSAAIGIRAALQSAKGAAIKNQTTVRINFTTGTGSAGSYVVFIDTDGNGTLDGGEVSIRSGSMNQNITLDNPTPNPERFLGNFTQFNSMGLPPLGRNGAICVRNNTNTLFKKITLENSGNITIEKSVTGLNGPWVK